MNNVTGSAYFHLLRVIGDLRRGQIERESAIYLKSVGRATAS